MAVAFDRIIVAVPDLEEAIGQCRSLLGATAWPASAEPPTAWLGLSNTVLVLVDVGGGGGETGIRGLVVSDKRGGREVESLPNDCGLDLALCDGTTTAEFRNRETRAQSPGLRVDHLVLRTADGDACVSLFAEQLGIRLALDKTVPEWGGRMLFFRAGKLTLEVIEPNPPGVESDHFWGIAYQCADIEQELSRMRVAGVSLSEIRDGRKPGTRVATVRSHCLGIPTLLIQPTVD
jgi:predicted enzyme related to lactoylglutathione lyase